jgi:hypothetical protein
VFLCDRLENSSFIAIAAELGSTTEILMHPFLNKDALKKQAFVALYHFWCKIEMEFIRVVQLLNLLPCLRLRRILKRLLCQRDAVVNMPELNRPEIPCTKSNEESQNLSCFSRDSQPKEMIARR